LCSATYGDEFGCRINKKSEGAHGSHAGAVGITADTIHQVPGHSFSRLSSMALFRRAGSGHPLDDLSHTSVRRNQFERSI
jgi:hypothetical protein